MSEVVPTNGFSIPPGPAAGSDARPPAASMQPGYVPPAPAPAAGTGFTQADIDAAVAAAVAKLQPATPTPNTAAAATQPTAVQPGGFDITEERGADPVLDSFTNAFTAIGSGVDINRAIGNAIALGNPALIDNAYLAEKGGAQAAQLQTIAKAIVERVQTQTKAAADAVYSAAGGQAEWTAASAVFNQQAPAYLKSVVAGLLESGNPEGISNGAKYVLDYVRQQGLVPQPAGLVQSGASAMPAGQALDKAGFQEAMFKLDPNSRSFETERQALYARRALGKQLGK